MSFPTKGCRAMARGERNQDRLEVYGTGNVLSAEQDTRHGMRIESRRVLACGVTFAVVFMVVLILPTHMFSSDLYVQGYTFSRFFDLLLVQVNRLLGVFAGNPYGYEMRICGVTAAAVSGCALGLCGSTYQGAFNNPLAAPKTLGVMAGGAVGALAWVLSPLPGYLVAQVPAGGSGESSGMYERMFEWLWENDPVSWLFGMYGQPLFSVAGCFVVVGIVMFVTKLAGRGHLSNIIVIICGTVISTAVTALINFLRYSYSGSDNIDVRDALDAIENYAMVGNFYYQDLLIIVPPLLVCIVVILLMRNRFMLISFGDDEARSMGINVNRTRTIMILICTFMVGWAISFCGHIAFLGFISAHVARKIVGPDFRWLLPGSVFVGGTLILIFMWIAQSGLPFTSDWAIGAICSIVGSVIFLVLAVREGRRALDER